jgi:branched-chain amino acid transport system substrate-binding protein
MIPSTVLRFAGTVLAVVASAGFLVSLRTTRVAAADSSVISLGAPLPLTGPLAPFGAAIRAGYAHAVDEANAAGGITIGGQKKKVVLIVRDSQSEPNLVANEARTLVDEEGVSGLLGSVSPPLTIPLSTVAETKHVPAITTLTPVEAWAAANPQGWKYAYDVFFAEHQMTDLQFLVANLIKTNKRVALFTDNEQDGAVMGALWESKAPSFGYTIAYHATFPVGTSDYGSFIAEAKKSGATVLIAQMIPPDAFALWKQMKSLGYAPAIAFCEKCADARGWSKELGPIGNGTMAAGFWSPTLGRPQTKAFVDAYEPTYGNTIDLANVVMSYTIAKVMMDAIRRAGTTDPDKVNAEIAKTDANLVGTDVRFNEKHQSIISALMLQWQNSVQPMVYPRAKAVASIKPLGL